MPDPTVLAHLGVRPDGPAWQSLGPSEAAARLGVDPALGLSPDEAASRLAEGGPNRLAEPPKRSKLLLFVDQFRSFLVYILLGAALLAVFVGEPKDPIVIGIVLLVNAILGYAQEAKAEKSMEALKRMLVLRVRVRRGGRVLEVPSEELVPGDVVLLDAGDRVPADGRLLVAASLAVDESALTGESEAVEKSVDAVVAPDAPVADRVGCAYMNTVVTRGRGELLVTATGMATEIGKVAEMLAGAEQADTPLQRQLDDVGKRISAIAGIAVVVVFVQALVRDESFNDAMLTAVALAVAAIPEGLPAVVAVTLAVGTHQMAKRNAIVKRLASVETLGSTSVICSDKTGTLTLNQMTARAVMRGGRRFAVSGQGYRVEGAITADGGGTASLDAALVPAALCNEATVRDGELVGDPTEGALLVVAAKGGVDRDAWLARLPRVAEIPFDSAAKFMATFHAAPDGSEAWVFAKGAPDVLLGRSATEAGPDGDARSLDAAARERVHADVEVLASQGLRVLGLASRRIDPAVLAGGVDDDALQELVADLRLEALVGILDPPRAEARDAIVVCRRAGIAVKMITGDHKATAAAIAADLGIEGEAVSGADLDAMSDEELGARIEGIGVCARVSPEHKVRIVKALRARRHVVAMTGDGVNDAAALKNADIGVAMGITGTEVTKEAGDMVLADDNFATIVGAVERGRTIYDNIVKFVRFQLSTNMGAILTILGAGMLGWPTPFTPIQVLWVNLIMDGPPAIALGVDPPSPGIMERRPRPPGTSILNVARVVRLLAFGLVMAIGTLWMYDYGAGLAAGEGGEASALGITMAFTTFVFFQFFNVLNARTERTSVFGRHTLTNGKLWLALGGVALLQVAAVKLEPLQRIFDTTALSPGQWALCIAVSATILVFDELYTLVLRRVGR
ncbi:MAG: HAD-IC family P-type ATPase [Acidimicrobiales bacterium]|nr:HAD-IC family P-type ATPase [Acidimicrobiales bacterium]